MFKLNFFRSEKSTGYFSSLLVYFMYKLLPGKDFVRNFIIRTTGIVIRQMKKTVLRSSSEEWKTSESPVSLMRYGSTGKYQIKVFLPSVR